MEENWTQVKKKSGGSKNTADRKNGDCFRSSQSEPRSGQNHSTLKSSNEISKPFYRPPSVANKNHVTFSKEGPPKRGGHRGGGGYRPRRQPEIIPDFSDPEEEEKFKALQKEIPHIKMPGEMRRLAATIRIDGLADKMLTDEWIEFQRNGWEYDKVVTPNEDVEIPDGDGYELLSIDNKWGDFVLFRKIK